MPKGNIFKICFFIVTLAFSLQLYSYALAGDCAEKGDQSGIPTSSGNVNYTDPWRCQCPPTVAFEFDDANTSDTITSGGSIDVYVKGGCPPFTWGDPGTGYSWAYGEDVQGVPGSKQTKTRSNQLICSSGT